MQEVGEAPDPKRSHQPYWRGAAVARARRGDARVPGGGGSVSFLQQVKLPSGPRRKPPLLPALPGTRQASVPVPAGSGSCAGTGAAPGQHRPRGPQPVPAGPPAAPALATRPRSLWAPSSRRSKSQSGEREPSAMAAPGGGGGGGGPTHRHGTSCPGRGARWEMQSGCWARAPRARGRRCSAPARPPRELLLCPTHPHSVVSPRHLGVARCTAIITSVG